MDIGEVVASINSARLMTYEVGLVVDPTKPKAYTMRIRDLEGELAAEFALDQNEMDELSARLMQEALDDK